MASKAGGTPSDLGNIKSDLLKNGKAYSFYQALRLLWLIVSRGKHRPGKKEKDQGNEPLRVRPDLSLSFPSSDISGIEEIDGEEQRFRVTATFLGLYGSSSPLPTFYTEDLIDEASEDSSVSRDFIDIINHRLYSLLFQCWTKYRQSIKVIEEQDSSDLDRLYCLLGIGEKSLRNSIEAYSLIRYAGLFSSYPRSSMGLKTLLKDSFQGVDLEVIPCVKRRVSIPRDQRFKLGTSNNKLGTDCYLGDELTDRMGKFRIVIGPVDSHRFNSFLRNGDQHGRLAFLTKFYLEDPLEYDIELIMDKSEVKTVSLGMQQWARLGLDTWTFTGEFQGEVRTVFPPQSVQGGNNN